MRPPWVCRDVAYHRLYIFYYRILYFLLKCFHVKAYKSMQANESFVVFDIEIDRTTYSHRYIEIWITWIVNAKVWNGKAYYVTVSKVDEKHFAEVFAGCRVSRSFDCCL